MAKMSEILLNKADSCAEFMRTHVHKFLENDDAVFKLCYPVRSPTSVDHSESDFISKLQDYSFEYPEGETFDEYNLISSRRIHSFMKAFIDAKRLGKGDEPKDSNKLLVNIMTSHGGIVQPLAFSFMHKMQPYI